MNVYINISPKANYTHMLVKGSNDKNRVLQNNLPSEYHLSRSLSLPCLRESTWTLFPARMRR